MTNLSDRPHITEPRISDCGVFDRLLNGTKCSDRNISYPILKINMGVGGWGGGGNEFLSYVK